MSTTRLYNAMLNDYLTYELLKEESEKRSYLLDMVEQDNDWKGGPLPVPFKGSRASSYSFGGLTASSDISDDDYVRGEVSDYKEIWGAIRFRARDLMEHDPVEGQPAMVSEQSFLKILPDALEDFIDGMKEAASINLLTGSHFAKLTSDATANDGTIIVDRPERFCLKQKVVVDDDATAAATGYVDSIDINASTIVLMTARGGATPIDFNSVNKLVAQNARVYIDGAQSNSFTSLKSQLLPLAQGGSAQLFGQTKLDYPYLQCPAVPGSAVTSSNILDKIFDGWTTIRKIGKGMATEVWVSYTHLGSIMKLLEIGSGPYRHVETKVSLYGWTEIIVVGVKGQLKIVGINEMDDSEIFYIDKRGMKLHSNGFFRKQVDPEGKQYYVVREQTGYYYITDICFFGELVVNRPSHMGVMYDISY